MKYALIVLQNCKFSGERNTKFRNIQWLVVILAILSSCSIKEEIFGTYHSVSPEGKVELLADSTYIASYFAGYTMSGLASPYHSDGEWLKKGDTLILNSKFDSCSIYRVKATNSNLNTNQHGWLTVNYVKPKDSTYEVGRYITSNPFYVIFFQQHYEYGDTIYLSRRGVSSFEKKNYTQAQVFFPKYCVNGCTVKSQKIEIHLADTINLFYDYGYEQDSHYKFFENKKFIIDFKQKTIEPITDSVRPFKNKQKS